MQDFCLALLFQEIDVAILETSHAGLNVAVVFFHSLNCVSTVRLCV